MLDPDRLFPADPGLRALARDLHEGVRSLPILSSHGHTDPRWFAGVQPFAGPAEQLVIPDHHVFRMLCSRGIALENRGIPRLDGGAVETGTRAFCAIPAATKSLGGSTAAISPRWSTPAGSMCKKHRKWRGTWPMGRPSPPASFNVALHMIDIEQ